MFHVLLIGALLSAAPQVGWQKAIDNQSTEKAHGSILTPDGEALIVAGEAHEDVWVYKLSIAEGDSIWAQVHDNEGNPDEGHDVALSGDGGIVFVGARTYPDADPVHYICGFSGGGDLLWTNHINLNGRAGPPSLCCGENDTCYLAAWCLRDYNDYGAELHVITEEGVTFPIWQTSGPNHSLTGIDLDSEGNIFLSQGEFDYLYLWKRASDGSYLWLSWYREGSVDVHGWQCRVAPDGHIFMCGERITESTDFLLLKWNPDSIQTWDQGKHYDLGGQDYCRDLAVDAISDCYLAGWQVRGEEADVALVKTDSAGRMLWSWVLEQTGDQEIEAIEVDSEGYIYLAGSHHNGENWDMLVMQVRQPLTISGVITDTVGASMSGVPVKLSGDTTVEVLSDTDGFYSIEVYNGGNYVVTPDLPGWAFLPSSRTYTPLAHRELDQDFSGEWTAILESTPSTSITLEVAGGPRGVLKVSFKTPNGQVASLSVYDTSGQLIERMEVAGSGSTAIPAMPSGVYFVRLDAGFRVCTEKVVVAR